MFSWLTPKKPNPPVIAPPADEAGTVGFSDLFGARAATAPPKKASPVSLDIAPEEPPAPKTEPAPAEPATHPARVELEALLAAKRIDDAARVHAALPETLADQEWHAAIGLHVAQQRNERERALGFARRLIAISPANPTGYVASAFTLRLLGRPAEAEAVAVQGLAAAPSPRVVLESALTAEAIGDHDLALARWAELRARLPDNPAGFQGALKLASKLQLLAPMAQLTQEGLARFPNDPALLGQAARDAARSQMWDEAEQLWTRLLAVQPDDPALALEAATSLMGPRAGRLQRLPHAMPYLERMRARFPDYTPAWAAHVTALREAGELDEAATLGGTLLALQPGDAALAIACASVAEEGDQLDRSVAILEAARAGRNPDLQIEVPYIRALSLAGRHVDAERACEAAFVHFPGHMRLIEQHVALATRQGEFEAAARRAEHWRAQSPNHDGIARLASRMAALHDSQDPAHQAAVSDGSATARLFARFESLGATAVGCEFGIVQRKFGADPIGLLRWGNMRVQGLTRALLDRFDGFGDEAHTTMKVQQAGTGDPEYFIYDDRYHYYAHTWIRADEAPQEQVYRQTLRRIHFLRDKLIEDLHLAEKIFVFKVHQFTGLAPLERLFDALRTYGPCTLLCMTLADEEHEGGTVEMVRPGLFVGRVSMFGNAGLTAARGIDTHAWLRVCETVAAWHDGALAARSLPAPATAEP